MQLQPLMLPRLLRLPHSEVLTALPGKVVDCAHVLEGLEAIRCGGAGKSEVDAVNFGESLWDTIWWFFWAFAFIAYLFVLFGIITDLFRDRSLNGWLKAVWLIFLLFLPFLTSLIYLIARGRGMAERSHEASQAMRMDTESYIRGVAGTSPSEEIAKAKELLDSGAINQQEFEHVKARALKLEQPSTTSGSTPGAAPANPGANR